MRNVSDVYDVLREVEKITNIRMKEYVCNLDERLKQTKLLGSDEI